jgi:type IV fimbrial biogenesis protein FimT
MTIVAILLGIGVPSYRYVTTSNRLSSEVNGLLGDLQFARSEAIREGQTITVCSSTDGQNCAVANTTAWHNGWIVFSDANNDQTVQSATEPVLRVQRSFSSPDDFESSVSAVTFNREGFSNNVAAAGIIYSLHDAITGYNATYTRCLAVAMVGTATTITPTTPNPPAWAPPCT